MKKIILSITLMLSVCTLLKAQTPAPKDTVWRKGGIVAVNFNQISLSNWAAGGEDALSLNALANLFANYKKNKWAWDNNLDLGYGILKQGDASVQKNEDKIDFTSKIGRDAYKSILYYTFLLNFKSQFDKGYAYPDDSDIVSQFAAPAYVLLSLGMDYKPNNSFSLFLSPLTAKFTIVNNQDLADGGAFGVDPAVYDDAGNKIADGKKSRSEFGAYMNAKFQKDIIENVNLMTKLELFSNYADNPQNVDVNWEILLSMKVNRFITASIYTQLIYDDNVPVPVYEGSGLTKTLTGFGPRTQFKEVLGVGFSYKFNSVTVK